MKWQSIILILVLLVSLLILNAAPAFACGGKFACGDGNVKLAEGPAAIEDAGQTLIISSPFLLDP